MPTCSLSRGRDLDKAERMSYRTIQERPDDINSPDTYAWILFKQKKYTEALVYIQQALDLVKEPAEELYSHAGDIYFWNGEHEKAVELWQQALSIAPDNELLKRKVAHKHSSSVAHPGAITSVPWQRLHPTSHMNRLSSSFYAATAMLLAAAVLQGAVPLREQSRPTVIRQFRVSRLLLRCRL